MTESISVHITELTEIFQRAICFRPHFKAVMPEDLANLKARLGDSHPLGKGRKTAHYDLFYNIAAILSLHQEPVAMGELSKALAVPLSTATRIVDWLYENNYAERLPDPADRRIVLVSLTEAGQGMYRTINEFIRKRVERLLRRLTPEERQTLIVLMQKILTVIEEEA
jgi:DNA-binding MarR family transcriptional regulator